MNPIPLALRKWSAGVIDAIKRAPAAIGDVFVATGSYATLLCRTPMLYVMAVSAVLFWLLTAYTEFWPVYLALNFVIIALELIILFVYCAAFLVAMVTWPPRQHDQLIMGIYIAWGTDLVSRTWNLAWLYTGTMSMTRISDIVPFFLFGRLIGATLHVTAPAAVEGRLPSASIASLGIAFVAGVLAAAAAFLFFSAAQLNPF